MVYMTNQYLFQMLIFLIKKTYSNQCRRNKMSKYKLKFSEEFQTRYSRLFACCVISPSSFIDLWQIKSWADSNFFFPQAQILKNTFYLKLYINLFRHSVQ